MSRVYDRTAACGAWPGRYADLENPASGFDSPRLHHAAQKNPSFSSEGFALTNLVTGLENYIQYIKTSPNRQEKLIVYAFASV